MRSRSLGEISGTYRSGGGFGESLKEIFREAPGEDIRHILLEYEKKPGGKIFG